MAHEPLPPMLVPAPRRLALGVGRCQARSTWRVRVESDTPTDTVSLANSARNIEIRQHADADGVARIDPTCDIPAGGYRLTITASDEKRGTSPLRILASDATGVRHALQTLAQLTLQYREIPTLEIEDEPGFPIRALMFDVSRTRVPTMEHLREVINTLARLKMNHLQLYTEHAFAYAGHEDVWRDASPITPDEVRTLDAYARDHGITLVANQNCFGHLARWLKLPKYAHLAETQSDWRFLCWPRSGPFSLCPTDPRSLEFVEGLLDQLLPCFSSDLVNIGCDETYDIEFGRSKDEVTRLGRHVVYAKFVNSVAQAVLDRGRRPMFWADIALSRPEAFEMLPKELIALAWGYEDDSPFARWCETICSHGREAWICPGTSSWRSIAGRTTERRANIANAARGGVRHGAGGFLVCDWGDTGHHQQWPITLNALAQAAHAAWNPERADNVDREAVSMHILGDKSLRLADLLDTLGDADLVLRETCGDLARAPSGPSIGTRLRNQSAIFLDLLTPDSMWRDTGAIEHWVHAVEVVRRVAREVPSEIPTLISDELAHTLAFAEFAAERGLRRRTASDSDRPTLAAVWTDRLHALEREHTRLWHLRSRPGGLTESCSHFETMRRNLGLSAPDATPATHVP
ncbi:MAG: family 20 glycosylhydrolase [Phycisphaerales bacterium]|nr:MAG: family 20 glycosylhydrolase [Phycisphaerales bacterium]